MRATLADLAVSPPTAEEQITDIIAQFEAVVAAALADPTSDCVALAGQLEEVALEIEDGEQESSPYLALATQLRALAAQLTAPPTDESATDSA